MIEVDTESALFYGMISLFFLVIITLIALLWHSGLFCEIVIKTCKPCLEEITIAYKFARGPYKDSGTLFTEAHTLLPQYRTIGVYYDDPKKKEASRLRYVVGLIVSENGKEINKEDEVLLKERGFSFATFPKIDHAVVTSFPFNSTISIIIAIFRVYPLLDEYIESRSLCVHPIIEVYDCNESKIFFYGPLEKQDGFYVPEIKCEDEQEQLLEFDEKGLGLSENSSLSCEESETEKHPSEDSCNEPDADIPPFSSDELPLQNKRKERDVADGSTESSFEEIDEEETRRRCSSGNLKAEE